MNSARGARHYLIGQGIAVNGHPQTTGNLLVDNGVRGGAHTAAASDVPAGIVVRGMPARRRPFVGSSAELQEGTNENAE